MRSSRLRQQRSAATGVLIALLTIAGAPAVAQEDASPRYLIESIEIVGNDKTQSSVIRRALQVRAGMLISVDDPRFELSRFRIFSLGYFSDVKLRLRRGARRGRVVLVVQVAERGTILLTDLLFGTSEATSAWGGLGLAETNFLGRGISLEGAFVLGADPKVERGSIQQAYWLRVAAPRFASRRVEFAVNALYLDGSDFFRQRGFEQSSDPDDFLSIRYRRVGGAFGAGFDLTRYSRMTIEYRAEAIESDVPVGAVRRIPDGGTEPIAFAIRRGDSRLSNFSIVLERDTRSDPVVPERGSLINLTADFSSGLFGSSYDYVRLTASYRHYFPLRWGHIFAFQVAGGVVFGEAPFFEKFFIGDFNDLVPSRALGLNFSTLPSRDFFGTSIDSKRYEEIAVRATTEYVVPWFRRGRWFYSGDFFVSVGLIFLTSKEELRFRDRSLSSAIPVDLTLNAGLRLDTRIGVFRLSLGNALGRIPF